MKFKGQGFTSSTACPDCGSRSLEVIEARRTATAFRRRKQCNACHARHTTYEVSSDWYQQAEHNAILRSVLTKHLGATEPAPSATSDPIPCYTCKLAGASACDLGLPEYGTADAIDCIHFNTSTP